MPYTVYTWDKQWNVKFNLRDDDTGRDIAGPFQTAFTVEPDSDTLNKTAVNFVTSYVEGTITQPKQVDPSEVVRQLKEIAALYPEDISFASQVSSIDASLKSKEPEPTDNQKVIDDFLANTRIDLNWKD